VTDRLLTADELADVLTVPVSWVRDHTRSGAIPHLELGRYKRYRLDEVEAWLSTCRKGGIGSPRFRRYDPTHRNGPRDVVASEGPTPKE
jgi:excisionase family DNA binding protein